MQASEDIDLIQQRLGDPLSEEQLEYLLKKAAEEPALFSAACQEIKAQKLEVIPVDLDDQSAMDDLVAWLNQLASTRNAGKGFNNLVIGIAVLLLIGAVGSWFAFFGPEKSELVKKDLPETLVTENSTDIDEPINETSSHEIHTADNQNAIPVSYTHLRAHETDS